jgi:GNAT superfamily N-acetyltransferase
MGAIPENVRRLAEDLNVHTPLGPGEERVVRPGWVLYLGPGEDPHFNVALRFRLLPGEVEAAVGEVRASLARRGRNRSTFEVGPSATPGDLGQGLEALGMVPDPADPVARGMVLFEPSPSPDSGVEVRRVTTPEDLRASNQILRLSFGAADEREEIPPGVARYLALENGEPISTAVAIFTDAGVILGGGATLPAARGRGAYRALVRARWEDAVRRGTPALVTQAGAMSFPILTRLGFREVARIHIYLDEPK